jgi:endonuclease YncB( thermonuclease family)
MNHRRKLSIVFLLTAVSFASVPGTLAGEARRLACIELYATDGDSITCDGTNMRDMGDGAPFVSGYDTPEIQRRKCDQELELGRKAKRRMEELLSTPGIQVFDSDQFDKTQSRRPLVWVKLPSGRTVGNVLISEGLARKWTHDYRADWCAN